MAYLNPNGWCPNCKKSVEKWDHATYCEPCGKEIAEKNHSEHFSKLDAMSIEERVRRIEDWIYNYKPAYVSPPRF